MDVGRAGVYDSPMATDFYVLRFGFMFGGGRSGMHGLEALQVRGMYTPDYNIEHHVVEYIPRTSNIEHHVMEYITLTSNIEDHVVEYIHLTSNIDQYLFDLKKN